MILSVKQNINELIFFDYIQLNKDNYFTIDLHESIRYQIYLKTENVIDKIDSEIDEDTNLTSSFSSLCSGSKSCKCYGKCFALSTMRKIQFLTVLELEGLH